MSFDAVAATTQKSVYLNNDDYKVFIITYPSCSYCGQCPDVFCVRNVIKDPMSALFKMAAVLMFAVLVLFTPTGRC